MHVSVENSIATVTMTVEELGSLRYGLAEGRDKLKSSAIFHESMKNEFAESAARTAKRVSDATDALETAVREWIDRPVDST